MTPILLLHGLTFDHRQWDAVRRELPGHPVLALDLPGHGATPPLDAHRTDDVAAWVHERVVAAGLDAPIVAGHSLGGVLATVYAARYPARGVIDVDQPLLLGGFGALVRRAEPVLRGPDWRTVWDGLVAGMHAELLPAGVRPLTVGRPSAALLLGYWAEILEHDDEEIARRRAAELSAIAARGLPYTHVASTEPPAAYRRWLTSLVPDASVAVIPGGGHFPHLADPRAVARLIAAQSSRQPAGPPAAG
ncbi:alpha/beta fold hydrolase [Catenuloplanes atrovinosus]|uniref:Pimeloyl-ACP methyl ester carboxylesterase n=1 Tax=Catenuloplanes atrovinosus TaxID=137266 RepID=A0AAE3YPX5_9ACTN|nr:alpha/beta fold hydrolase [Catenuloplanes atrovinosus]MDR7276460.1 pimeloyl-ACP methyl ester carboxylesterase [Catenuloplanes atrovinosus]